MKCIFKTLTIHNFLSFGDATIDLTSRGYCLISGRNKNPSDRALSNGSGKSTITSAICWALTGQTIQGIKSNIENIHTTGGCFVSLVLSLDGDVYEITRYKNHEVFKTDLKIICNGEDISGKGISKSEEILASRLPDLTKDLLTSVILLGQGLPNSFTKNTPSGRKELLEKLTGSDFMIQDVKDRIYKRTNELEGRKREQEDIILSLNTKKGVYETSLDKNTYELNKWVSPDYDTEIALCEESINELSNKINATTLEVNSFWQAYCKSNEEVNSIKAEKVIRINEVDSIYSGRFNEIMSSISQLSGEIKANEDLKRRYNSIIDVCPTCGQKIPNVHKIDTSEIELKLEELTSQYNKRLEEKQSLLLEIQNKKEEAKNKSDEILNKKLEENLRLKNSYDDKKRLLDTFTSENSSLSLKLERFKYDKENSEKQFVKLKQEIKDLEDKISEINNNLLYTNKELDKINQHLEVVNKMNTLVKRDFRGYLLLNILNAINVRAKEYCKYIFNTNDLDISLNGNNIDVIFSGKEFELLSGGEKQKVDLVIQFAIRDMMSKYLNFNSNILFLDEITDNLDSVGCDGLLNLISNSLNDVESLFIISHHSDELALPTDSEIIVEKNSDGISRVVS